ncbi:hypothetical protein KO525_17290 [Psychrosphaera sp. B3R10]|uniref:TonB-dependent receptor plug domain-containing protein n=1 Tax=unclassified Psychrosphaera TaxID=2641570 RepID=UPI001C097E88|nr:MULTISPECIES: hypothetical protein [unclassified Psychrosphaera]MBU2881610.1 hypothetical protein [Psychrosphaera sp. I2R16]MBU2991135.1 hypothetical protein [Psychrosphaera sp. B3R10]MDO6719538.1 hypothetical protein [Psychrosphaera sp. 1_MG-2023]
MNKSVVGRSIKLAVFGTTICLSWALSAEEAETEVVEEVEKIRVIGSKDSGLELSSEKILKVPGAGNDPIRAVESLPGVVLANGFAPAVRGSSPFDMYYQSDDVPIGNVFHNDSVSTFHPNLIKSFELKTGAWESDFADAIGGVIDTKLREPGMTDFTATVDLSFLRTGILVESRLSDKSAFYFAYRQSLIHLYIENFLDDEDFQFTQAPINNDYQFKYLYNVDGNNKLVVQATGSNDEVGILFADESKEVKQNPDLVGGIGVEQFYHNQSVIWTNYSDYGETKFIVNRLERNGDLAIGQIVNLDAVTIDYLAKVINNQSVEYGELTIGGELRSQSVDYSVSGKLQPCNPEFEVCPPSYYADSVLEVAKIDVNFVNLFADYDWDIAEDWVLKLGAAASTNDYTNETFVEPRLAVRYQLNNDYRMKLAYGEHHQWFREYKYLSQTFGSPDLKLAKAKHYVFGIEHEGESDWAWSLETYYKKMDDLIVSNPQYQVNEYGDPTEGGDGNNYVNEGQGDAYGIEFLLNKAISAKWYGWLSVAYSKTERNNNITNESFRYVYDLPWIVNMVGNYEINNEWQLGLRWRFQSGSLYTPINGATPVYPLDENGQPDESQEPIFYDPNEGDFNSERLEAFHRLDIRLDYETKMFGNDTNIYFEVLNLYGQKSLSGYDYNEDYTEREPEYQFPEIPIPSFGIQMVF